MNLPLKEQSADVTPAFGSLHHMIAPDDALSECIRVVRPSGYIGFHEPISTPKLIPEGTRLREFAERTLEEYEHSQHDNEIDHVALIGFLEKGGFGRVAEIYSNSVLVLVFNRLGKLIPFVRDSRLFACIVLALGSAWIKCFGRLTKRLGPRAVAYLARSTG